MDILSSIGFSFGSALLFLAGLFGVYAPPAQDTLGASVNAIAGHSYNLSGAGISSSATSLTLASLTIKQTGQKIADTDLADTFFITVEPGNTTRQEIISCTTVTQNANGTASLSGCSRGLSPITPYTASTTLQMAHAGGSVVIFSDPPQLFNQYGALSEDETVTGQWTFSTFPITASNATSSETIAGVVELATGAEAAASTQTGNTTGRLVLPASLATSTYNSLTAPNRVLVTGLNGVLDLNFLGTTTIAIPATATTTMGTTTIIGSTYAFNIGKFQYATTSIGTATWSRPTGVQRIYVELVGGGAGGAADAGGAGGGGGGAYCAGFIDVSASSSIQFTIGAGGAGAAAGSNSLFSTFLTSGGGTAGSGQTGGAGGDCTLGTGVADFLEIENFDGETGGEDTGPTPDFTYHGGGGDNVYGHGASRVTGSDTPATGFAGSGYGAGGSGAQTTGGAGTPGMMIIRW